MPFYRNGWLLFPLSFVRTYVKYQCGLLLSVCPIDLIIQIDWFQLDSVRQLSWANKTFRKNSHYNARNALQMHVHNAWDMDSDTQTVHDSIHLILLIIQYIYGFSAVRHALGFKRFAKHRTAWKWYLNNLTLNFIKKYLQVSQISSLALLIKLHTSGNKTNRKKWIRTGSSQRQHSHGALAAVYIHIDLMCTFYKFQMDLPISKVLCVLLVGNLVRKLFD